MKRIHTVFMALALSLALCAGTLMSCDAGEDNSAVEKANAEAEKTQKEAEEQAKLINIGVTNHDNPDKGLVAVRDSGTEGGIARHYSDSTKQFAVIYFEAIPSSGYKFNINNLVVTTTPASSTVSKALYTEKTNYFSVTVPITSTSVSIDSSNAFDK